MQLKSLAIVFGTVLLAELGDKTQLATVLFSVENPTSKWFVFAAAAAALVLSAGVAVFAGGFISQHVNTKLLSQIAGVGFVLIGVWTFLRA